MKLLDRATPFLKWTEKYTKIDMTYLARGAFWSNLNFLLLSILSFIISILFARLLTKEAYGTYQYILGIAGLVSATSLTGMNNAITRAVAQGNEGEVRRGTRFQIKLAIIPTVFALAISGWYLFHAESRLALSFLWVALFLPLANSFNTWAAYLGGKKLFRIGTYFGLLNTVISALGIIALTYFTRNFIWIVFGNFFFGLLGNFIIYNLVIRKIPPNTKTDTETIPYGTHLSIITLPGLFASQLDSLLIFHFIGPAALAIYSFATIIPEKLAGALKFVSNIALPKFSEKNESEVRNFLFKKIWLILLALGILAGLYALIAPFFFHFFFPTYTNSIILTQVYSLSLFSVASVIIQTALTSQRKTKALYIASVTNSTLKTVLILVLMYYFGVWGIIWAQILANIVAIPFQILLYNRSSTAVK